MAREAHYTLDNDTVADCFERVADLLEAQEASPFRVRAYRAGARSVRAQPRPVAELVDEPGALEALPAIGDRLARWIRELARTGRLGFLERLEGEVCPEALLATVPGIGPTWARRIHEELGVESLEDLEVAAHDGRLEAMRGFGPRRARGVREALAGILGRATRRRVAQRRIAEEAGGPRPPVRLILELDEEYRRLAGREELPLIAPRRFNPEHRAWLPVWHVRRGGYDFTVLFSNTARAHELGRTHEWVVLYYERGGHEGRCTVVTEHAGPRTGERVVRGREAECAVATV